ARIEREHITRRRGLAQRQCDRMKITAVSRQAGETYNRPSCRGTPGPIMAAIEPQSVADGKKDVFEALLCRRRHALVLPSKLLRLSTLVVVNRADPGVVAARNFGIGARANEILLHAKRVRRIAKAGTIH